MIPIAFIGVAIPKEIMSELSSHDNSPGFQGFNHSWLMINSLECFSRNEIKIIAYPQISDYPVNARLIVFGKKWKHGKIWTDCMIFTVNIFPFKLILRSILVLVEGVKWLFQVRKIKNVIIISYSSQSSQLLPIILLSIFKKFTKIVVLTDPPSMVLPYDGLFKRNLRKIDRYLQKFLLKGYHGGIVLAEKLAFDWMPNKPYIVIEGISPDIEIGVDENVIMPRKFVIGYAGTLKEEYGIKNMLESAKYLPSDVEIWIYGGGELSEFVSNYSIEENRIKYYGFMVPDELRKNLLRVSAFISPLPSTEWYTHYKFPSKLLEYMRFAKPVISTKYPSIPSEYNDLLVWITEESPKGIAMAIKKVYQMSEAERKILGKKCLSFVENKKSIYPQGQNMWNFITKIENRR